MNTDCGKKDIGYYGEDRITDDIFQQLLLKLLGIKENPQEILAFGALSSKDVKYYRERFKDFNLPLSILKSLRGTLQEILRLSNFVVTGDTTSQEVEKNISQIKLKLNWLLGMKEVLIKSHLKMGIMLGKDCD